MKRYYLKKILELFPAPPIIFSRTTLKHFPHLQKVSAVATAGFLIS